MRTKLSLQLTVQCGLEKLTSESNDKVFAISDRHNMLFLLFKGDHGAAGEMGLPGRDGNAVS